MEEPERHQPPEINNPRNDESDSVQEIDHLAEEEMEQMLLAQDAEEQEDLQHLHDLGDGEMEAAGDGNLRGGNDFGDNNFGNNGIVMNNFHIHEGNTKRTSVSYVNASFLAAFVLVFYAFRSRQQWYLALVFLSSSKWAYIILGNALIAFLIWIFQLFNGLFLNGLRLAEAEGLGDFFRWNVTETCLALTIFRSELTVKTCILFLILVLAKCLHWVADTREGHLRMTEEVIVSQPNSAWPALRWTHLKLLMCLYFLMLVDMWAVIQCGFDIVEKGPSVSILFAFEGAIMLTSVFSNVLLWFLHLVDGVFHYLHETTASTSIMHRWIHPWKDHKATFVFAVEVQAQAAKFCFYLSFFAIVMTYYGLPINLIREVYISFQQLKQRLVAFKTYRKLMANMNRYQSPTSEELEDERTCIICRDEMTVETAKRLPGCGHIFHKSCLREWLVQQQTCPTCRSDISAMEARQLQQNALNANVQVRQQEEDQTDPRIDQTNETKDGELEATEKEETVKESLTNERAIDSITPSTSANEEPESLPATSLPDVMDRKPAAVSISRDKRVRISTPESERGDPLAHERDAFPAFYRVIQDAGADVYNDGEAIAFVIRVIPFGVVVVVHEIAWRQCYGESQMMVRVPDGWVSDEHLERIVAISF